jgi:hypothetical protein
MATRWRSPPDRRVPRWPTRGVQAVTHTGPCQKFARNYATRNLAPPHNAALDSALHLRRCVGTKGGAWHCEPPAHQWHARGQGFKSPQLHRRSEAQSGLDRPRIARPRQQIGSNRRRAGRSVAHRSATPAVPTGVVSWSDPSPITPVFGRAGEVGLEAASTCSGDRGQEREGAATCDSVAPIVTACARPDPQIPDAVRT